MCAQCNTANTGDHLPVPDTVLGAGGTKRKEIFLPIGSTLPLEVLSDFAPREG